MKMLPGIFFLLLVLLSPLTVWADNGAEADGVSAEQTSGNGDADGKKKGKKKGAGEEEEDPDCE
ncbi:MAG: hypothetical protein OQL06_14185 [Gammaproteobacteria bacterium]|nr:hypothetical protein [Gammaproteobacteria bacterium]